MKNPSSLRPRRGFQWIGVVWIALICLFLIVRIVVDRQFTLGEPDGVLITARTHPWLFSLGLVFPGLIFISMVVLLVRGELRYRDAMKIFLSDGQRKTRNRKQD